MLLRELSFVLNLNKKINTARVDWLKNCICICCVQEARYYEYESASIVNIILFTVGHRNRKRKDFNLTRKERTHKVLGFNSKNYVTATKCFKPFTKLHEVATVILPLRPEERRVSRLVPIIILQSESETRRKADRDPKLL